MKRRPLFLVAVLTVLVLAACAPRPFAASSPWNTEIPSSAGWRDEPALRSGRSWVNAERYSVPVIRSAPSDPLVAVSVPASWGWPAGVVNVHVPAGVTGAAGDDGTLVIVSDGVAFDFWQFQRSDAAHANAAAWAAARLDGAGVGRPSPFLGAGIRAAGTSAFGGLITGDDLAGNDMRHALAVSLLGSELGRGVVSPAIADGGGGSGTIPMGSRIGIPRGTPMPGGLSTMGQRLWSTLVSWLRVAWR